MPLPSPRIETERILAKLMKTLLETAVDLESNIFSNKLNHYAGKTADQTVYLIYPDIRLHTAPSFLLDSLTRSSMKMGGAKKVGARLTETVKICMLNIHQGC